MDALLQTLDSPVADGDRTSLAGHAGLGPNLGKIYTAEA